MVRIYVKVVDCGVAANVGGPVNVDYRSFVVDAPALADYLLANNRMYQVAEVVGAEVCDEQGKSRETGE